MGADLMNNDNTATNKETIEILELLNELFTKRG
jgi:hypothetical protein